MKTQTNLIESTDKIIEVLDMVGLEELSDKVSNEFFRYIQDPAINEALEITLNNIISNNKYILDMLNN